LILRDSWTWQVLKTCQVFFVQEEKLFGIKNPYLFADLLPKYGWHEYIDTEKILITR